MRPTVYPRIASALASKKPSVESLLYWQWVRTVRVVAGEINAQDPTVDMVEFLEQCGVTLLECHYQSMCEQANREYQLVQSMITML